MINAIMLLTSFVEKAKAVVGYQVYAEAVIKLLRWGSRKCSGLLITGYNQIFQLGTNTIRPYIGAISDYEPSTDAEGNVYSIQPQFQNPSPAEYQTSAWNCILSNRR